MLNVVTVYLAVVAVLLLLVMPGPALVIAAGCAIHERTQPGREDAAPA